MEIPEHLYSLFTARLDERDGSYVFEVPEQEIQLGDLEQGETYRVAVLPSPSEDESDATEPQPDRERSASKPPVEEGQTLDVEIENIGDQGDGITRVERGFVVIVPDTDPGERVTVRISDVLETVAFADVVERLSYYD